MYITHSVTGWIVVLSFAVMASASFVYAETQDERRIRLEAELQQIEREIQQQQVLLEQKSGERQSLERDVAVLDAQINKAQLAIKQRNLKIAQIANDVTDRDDGKYGHF